MTPVPPVANTVRIDFVWQIGTDNNCRSHFYMTRAPGTVTKANLDAVAAAVVTNYNVGGNLKSQITGNATLMGVYAEDMMNPGNPVGFSPAAIAGTNGTGVLPAETCQLLNFHIASRYRGGKPRIYLPAMGASSLQAPQQWNSSQLNSTVTAWNALITALTGLAGPPVLGPQCAVHFIAAGVHLGVPTSEPVTAVTANLIPGSQRRRMNR